MLISTYTLTYHLMPSHLNLKSPPPSNPGKTPEASGREQSYTVTIKRNIVEKFPLSFRRLFLKLFRNILYCREHLFNY